MSKLRMTALVLLSIATGIHILNGVMTGDFDSFSITTNVALFVLLAFDSTDEMKQGK